MLFRSYAYTGEVPKFLGTWSIDVNGTNSKLEDLDGATFPVSVIGYRLAEDSVKDISEIEFEAKQAKEKEKSEKKQEKEIEKFNKKSKDLEHKRRLYQMDMETYLKIKERQKNLKELKKNSKATKGLTGAN